MIPWIKLNIRMYIAEESYINCLLLIDSSAKMTNNCVIAKYEGQLNALYSSGYRLNPSAKTNVHLLLARCFAP